MRSTWYGLRQQTEKQEIDGVMRPSRCLSDFVAPKGSGVADYVGLFAVTAGIGADQRAAAFEAAHDDYSAIMLKALADRLAEAFAESLHQRVRTDLWGYAPHEALRNDELIAEQYQGIPPGARLPGLPGPLGQARPCSSCCNATNRHGPDRSLAMTPAASVSGFYLAHPESHLLQRRQDRPGPVAGHGAAPRHGRGCAGPFAGPQPALNP